MTDDIIKRCANHLRTSLDENHNVKLKSAHAHEIVASLFGYKSKASMLADKKYSIAKLEKSELMMFERKFSFIDARIGELHDLPDNMPNNDIIAEIVYSLFQDKTVGQRKAYTAFEDMAINLAKPYLQDHLKKSQKTPDKINLETSVNTEIKESELLLTVLYSTSENKKYCDVVISFPRVAGSVGYGKYQITPTFYSGGAK